MPQNLTPHYTRAHYLVGDTLLILVSLERIL